MAEFTKTSQRMALLLARRCVRIAEVMLEKKKVAQEEVEELRSIYNMAKKGA